MQSPPSSGRNKEAVTLMEISIPLIRGNTQADKICYLEHYKLLYMRYREIMFSLLWYRHELNPRKEKLSWEEITKPKDERGLGLRCLRESNKVCCLKLLWRLLSR